MCRKTFERIFVFTIKKKIFTYFYSKNQAVNVILLKTKATVKLVYTKWRILEICCIFLYFQLQIRALYVDFETHVFIRFLISIKFSIIISHKKKKKRGGGGSRVAPVFLTMFANLLEVLDSRFCEELQEVGLKISCTHT